MEERIKQFVDCMYVDTGFIIALDTIDEDIELEAEDFARQHGIPDTYGFVRALHNYQDKVCGRNLLLIECNLVAERV